MRWYKCKKERKQNSSLIVGQVLGVWLRLSLIKVLLFKRRAFHDEISDSRVNRVQEIGLPSCGTIWLFLVMLSFSSQLLLEIFWSLQIPKLPAEFDRMKNWSEARESWNYVLGVFDSPAWGQTNYPATDADHNKVFPFSASLSHGSQNTTVEHTRQTCMCSTATHPHSAADKNRRRVLWIIEPRW